MKSSRIKRCVYITAGPLISGALRVGGDGHHYWAVRGPARSRLYHHEHHHWFHSMGRDCYGDSVCRGVYPTPRLEIGGTF